MSTVSRRLRKITLQVLLAAFVVAGMFAAIDESRMGWELSNGRVAVGAVFWDTEIYAGRRSSSLFVYPPPSQPAMAALVLGHEGFFGALFIVLSAVAFCLWFKIALRSTGGLFRYRFFSASSLLGLPVSVILLFLAGLMGNLQPVYYLVAALVVLTEARCAQFALGVFSALKPTMLVLSFIAPKTAAYAVVTTVALLAASYLLYPDAFHIFQQALSTTAVVGGDYGVSPLSVLLFPTLKNFPWLPNKVALELTYVGNAALCLALACAVKERHPVQCLLLVLAANPRWKIYDLPYLTLVASFVIAHCAICLRTAHRWNVYAGALLAMPMFFWMKSSLGTEAQCAIVIYCGLLAVVAVTVMERFQLQLPMSPSMPRHKYQQAIER